MTPPTPTQRESEGIEADIRSLRSMAEDGSSDFGSEKLRRIAARLERLNEIERKVHDLRYAQAEMSGKQYPAAMTEDERNVEHGERMRRFQKTLAALCEDGDAGTGEGENAQ